jgi:acyl dehydratase
VEYVDLPEGRLMAAARLRPGDALEPLVVERVDPGPMKTMAAILRDPNPIHWDAEAVRELGLGDRVINQGPIHMGYLINLVTRVAGGAHRLRHFQVRFMGNVFAGDRVECRGRVLAVDDQARTAELEIEAVVGDRVVIAGVATIAHGDPQIQ